MSRSREKRIRAEVGGNRAEARRIRRGRELSTQAGQGHGKVVYQAAPEIEKKRLQAASKATKETLGNFARRIGLTLPPGVGDD